MGMTSVGASLTVLFCLAVLFLPRRHAALAFVGAVMYITQGQTVEMGINFVAIRFVELAAAIRVIARRDVASVRMTPPDVWFVLFFVSYMIVTFMRTGTLDMFTIGLAVDAWLVFFAFRALIQTPEDFTHFMRGMVLLLVPFALLMVEESIRGRNLFSLMGGVPETPVYRDGHFRCQGSFRHAITAGSLGATFFPLFVGFLFRKEHRRWALIGVSASLTIVITSHSSGPLMATLVAVAAWSFWIFRHRMQWVRRGIVAAILGLHLIMKQPVWFIFDRISGVIGGDGWHRSNLIDKFVKNFGEWWLIGMPMKGTVDWAATVTKFGYVDVTNYYISIGINGGLVSLVVFLMMLAACFKLVGFGLKTLRKGTHGLAIYEPVLWGVGSAVCVHAINLTAVSYWDQSYVIWYLHLAMAVTLGRQCLVGESNCATTALPQNLYSWCYSKH